MTTNTEKALATVLGGTPAFLAPFSAAMADNTSMGGGMMGNASTYGHMYGISNAWLIGLAVIVLGIVLVAVLRRTR